MFKFFRKSTQSKSKNPANKRMKDFFKRSGDAVLTIVQVATSTATCFTIIKMRHKKKQLNKHQIIFQSMQSGDDKNSFIQKGAMVLQIAASIATVIASFATCVTVQEMKNERDQLYKPQMIFERSCYSDDYERSILGSGLWDAEDLADHVYDNTGNLPLLETTVYNIGSGPALEMEISFMLDSYKEYAENISQYFRDGTVIANDSGFTIYYDGGRSCRYYVDTRDNIIRKPFLLSGESMNIAFPEDISILLYNLNYCTLGDFSWEPKVRVQISFLDLQGIRYCIDYELVIKMSTNSSEQGNEYFHVDYYIEQQYLADEKYKKYEEYEDYYIK